MEKEPESFSSSAPTVSTSFPTGLGRMVGPYELLHRLGAGGMGEVWKARDTVLNRVVALKFIAAGGRDQARDLLREARAASALNHQNIVTIFQIGEHEGATYLAMELVEGETLRTYLGRGTPSIDEALDIARQILSGLASAHARGIIHRDLKPENVMLRVDKCVKLVDFGLAKHLPWSEAVAGGQTAATSDSGQLVGTFNYMSPEQARGKPVSAASDVFSLGIVLYELLGGVHPFRTEAVLDTLNAIARTEAPDLVSRRPDIPSAVGAIVSRALQKAPELRYASAVDMQESLERARQVRDEAQTSAAAPRHLAPRWLRAIAGLLLLVLAAVSGWLLLRPGDASEAQAQAVRSVAVMSFRTETSDPRTTALIGTLPEDLGAALAAAGFRVASRGSVMELGEMPTARAAGMELGVDAVLEGTVRSAGNAVRIYVELVSVRTRFQVWSGTFTVGSDAMMEGDSPVASQIADRIREALAGPR